MLRDKPDESRATRGHLVADLSKWAKFGVLAIVVADVAGVFLVQHRLNQPVPHVPSLSDDTPIAMTDAASALPKDALSSDMLARDVLARDNAQASDAVATRSLPVVSRADTLPAPMPIEPLALDTPQASPKVVRAMQAALRAPVIPTVRIAELHAVRKANRTFTTAFTSDISAATQSSRQANAYEAPSAGVGVADSATADLSGGNVTPGNAESFAAPVEAHSDVPTPEFGGTSQPQQLQLDLPAPIAPEARASATGELPAS